MDEQAIAAAWKLIPEEMAARVLAEVEKRPSRDAGYASLISSFAWRPIAVYDKAAAAVVLLREGEQVCAGAWVEATIFPQHTDDQSAMWRSAEEATLEMPLQFEPEEFAVLDDEAMHGFIDS